MNSDCLFCKIVAGEIPADIIHSDDMVVAFRDIKPQAPVHVLIIPREHIATVQDLKTEHGRLMGHIMGVVPSIAEKMNISKKGYRVVFNCNKDAGQDVFHVHAHLMGGRTFAWPPG